VSDFTTQNKFFSNKVMFLTKSKLKIKSSMHAFDLHLAF